MFAFLAAVKWHTAAALLIFAASIAAEAWTVYLLKAPVNIVQELGDQGSGTRDRGSAIGDERPVDASFGHSVIPSFGHFLSWFTAAEGNGAALRRALLLVIAAQVLRSFLIWARAVTFSWQNMATIAHMRATIYDRLQWVGFAFHDRYSSGPLINRALSDLKHIRQFLVVGLRAAVDVVITLVAYLGMLWICSPYLAAAALVPIPFWLWGLRVYARRSKPLYKQERTASDEVVRTIAENIAGAHVVRTFANEDYELRKFDAAHGKLFERLLAVVNVQRIMLPALRGIVVLAHVGLFTTSAWWVQGGHLQLGDLVIFGVAMNAILGKLQQLGTIAEAYQKATVSSGRLVEILDAPDTTPELPTATRLRKGPGAVRFHNVSFGYLPERPVLRHIGLHIPGGTLVAIVGPTGSGKSSLAALVGRCYDPAEGVVEIDGQDVRTATLGSVRREVGYVFQESFLFSDTIARNIAYGDLSAPMADVKEAAQIARAHGFVEQLPETYNTLLGEAGLGLSGGQRQRLGLARAILREPRILILDDAFSAVDAVTEAEILQELEQFRAGRTVLMITSRASTARHADLILVMEDGRITKQGTHQQLIAQDGYYRDIAASQFGEAVVDGGELASPAPQTMLSLVDLARPRLRAAASSRPRVPALDTDALSPTAPEEQATEDIRRYSRLDGRQLRRLGAVMWPYRWVYAAGVCCAVGMAACELVAPRMARRIVDEGIPSALPLVLLAMGGVWAGVMVVSLILESFQVRCSQVAGERVVRDLRRAMFCHLQRLSMGFFDRHKLGQIITRPTSDVEAIRDTVVGGLNTIVANLLLSIGAGTMIFLTDPVLFAAIAWLIPVLVLINARFRRVLGAQHQVVRAGFAKLAAYLAENISGVRVVAAFNRQRVNLARFNELQDENTRNNMRAAHLNGLYQPLLESVRLAGQVVLLGYGAAQVFGGRLTPGQVVAAFFYWDLFMRPTITLGTFYNVLMATMASSERVFDLLETEPEVRESPIARPLPALRRSMSFEHVTFGYEPDRPVLHDICLQIPVGKTIALVGATGSGKTTMIALLTRMYEQQQGAIRLDGVDIREGTLESLRKQMGVVLQFNYLFSGTILDNIRYARPEASNEDVYAAARALGVHEVFLQQPGGYQTDVGERGASVSLGVRQLICFARVLLADPPILLLDEATSSVDSATEEVVRQALKRVARHRTAIIVAHRLSTITDADQIVVMDKGRIIEKGSHVELRYRGGAYARLYEKFQSAGREVMAFAG
jgi:ATP-binding cassette subfamily B protein